MEQQTNINPEPFYKWLFRAFMIGASIALYMAFSSCSISHRLKHKEHTTVDSTSSVKTDSSYTHLIDSMGSSKTDSSSTVTTDSTGTTKNQVTEEKTTEVDSNTLTLYDSTGKPKQTITNYKRKETTKTTKQQNDSTGMKRQATTNTNKTNTSAKTETGTGTIHQQVATHKKADQRTADSNKWSIRLIPWWVWLIIVVGIVIFFALGKYRDWFKKIM